MTILLKWVPPDGQKLQVQRPPPMFTADTANRMTPCRTASRSDTLLCEPCAQGGSLGGNSRRRAAASNMTS